MELQDLLMAVGESMIVAKVAHRAAALLLATLVVANAQPRGQAGRPESRIALLI